MDKPIEEKPDALRIIDTGEGASYLTRCVALVTILHERGIIDELLESGRIIPEEVDQRVELLENNYQVFRGFKTSGAKGKEGLSAED